MAGMSAPPVGTPVTALLPDLLQRLAQGSECTLAEFEVAGRMQRRVTSVEVKQLVATALERRRSSHAPFWNEVLTLLHERASQLDDQSPDEGNDADERAMRAEVLDLAGYHLNLSTAATHHYFRGDAAGTRDALAAASSGLQPGRILALRSLCAGSGTAKARHLQMLDFRLPVEPAGQRLVEAAVEAMGLHGWLLSSGRSYHFLGDRTLTSLQALMDFLGRALLFAPIVDGRWVAHQMIEGQCALRVSSGNTQQIVPAVVAQV
jgi:hypothetical protein